MDKKYLKGNLKVEPYIWQWYAWTHLIAPHTAACNLVERYMMIMRSYIESPQVHIQAAKNPKMLGGPFLGLEEEYMQDIKNLLFYVETHCHDLISLNTDLKTLDQLLRKHGKGGSLEHVYNDVPANLQGMVELVYDLNSQPSFRLIENLFYNKFYNPAYQSVSLTLVEEDYRPFVLSTPHIRNADHIYLDIPFSDQRLDTLFASQFTGIAMNEIKDLLGIDSSQVKLFESFFHNEPFTETSVTRSNDICNKDVVVKYFGHACVLVQTADLSILFDPVISYNYESDIPRYTYDDLPETIDYLIVTHNHQDHVMFETLLKLRHKTRHLVFPQNNSGFLADPSLKLIFKKLGFNSLISLQEFEELDLPGGKIIALPFFGEHADLAIESKLSYCLILNNRKIIIAADSNNLEGKLYKHIKDITGNIDLLFIGMECDGAPLSWIYGPLLSSPISRANNYERKLSGSDFNKAWSIVQILQPKQVYVYAMGQEPWLNYVMALKYEPESIQITESNRLIDMCLANGIGAERLYGKKHVVLNN